MKQLKSTANHATKRDASEVSAQNLQYTKFTLSHFIQVMKSPEFRDYFETDFQSYLKGKRDISADSNGVWDRTELDIVMFLSTLFERIHGREISIEESPHYEPRTILGKREGIKYVKFPVKPSDNSIEGLSRSSAATLIDKLQHLGLSVVEKEGQATFTKNKKTYIVQDTAEGYSVFIKAGAVAALVTSFTSLGKLAAYLKKL